MVIRTSNSPEETFEYGRILGSKLRAGDVVGLVGDLGAGKTQLVKGIAAALGITDRVQSPTFALVNEYSSGPMPCYHIDLYRLETPAQIEAAGLQEYVPPAQGVTLVEWFDHWKPPLARPENGCVVRIVAGTGNERVISYEHFSP